VLCPQGFHGNGDGTKCVSSCFDFRGYFRQ
jgi:hypothetical protein